MNFSDPDFSCTGARNLGVVLHGYALTSASLNSVKIVAKQSFEYKGKIDIYAPTLSYSSKLDMTGASNIITRLVSDLDEIWMQQEYDHVIFIGHSLGGMLLRRLFLAGVPNPPDFAGEIGKVRDELNSVNINTHEWALKVGRIILLASWDKGWSLSPHISWLYSLSLNTLGFVGRVAELLGDNWKPGRTLLDARQGAPFIVQTRLLWMAYRRWHNSIIRKKYNKNDKKLIELKPPPKGIPNPLLIQIMGTLDDWVSPQDQIDYDVNAAEIVDQNFVNREQKNTPKANYFLLEMPDTNHTNVVHLTTEQRKDIFKDALTKNSTELDISPYRRKPEYFEDDLLLPDFKVNNVVFVMHGIRDNGYWTHRIAKAVKEAAEQDANNNYASWTQTYGYFPMGSFLLPWVRQQKVEWFMDKYVNVKARYPVAAFHYVGHSNGTFLVTSALKQYPAARFNNIYFAGSVVHSQIDWGEMIRQEKVKRFHNVRGATDWVVALLPKSLEYISDLGGAGFDGFENISSYDKKITQSQYYAIGEHGGAIKEAHWAEIAKYIVTSNPLKPFADNELESKLFQENKCHRLNWIAKLRIGIPFIFSLVALIILLFFSLWLPVQYWQWGATDWLNGQGFILWCSALLAFLGVQLSSVKQAPSGWKKKLSIYLMAVVILGIANFVLSSFYHQAIAISCLNPLNYAVAMRSVGSAFTLVSLIWILRFILKRY